MVALAVVAYADGDVAVFRVGGRHCVGLVALLIFRASSFGKVLGKPRLIQYVRAELVEASAKLMISNDGISTSSMRTELICVSITRIACSG
jgi:hypothetical protein